MESPMGFGKSPMIDSPQKRRVRDKILKPIFEKPKKKQLPQEQTIKEEEEKKETDISIPVQNQKKTEGVKNLLKKMEI